MSIAKISSKGQITIPKKIRELLKLKPGDRVKIEVEGGVAILKPLKKPSESIKGLGRNVKKKLKLTAVELIHELREEDVEELSELQARILANSAELLAPGGVLLYVTCTISRQENEDIVENFLQSYPRIELKNLKEIAPEWATELVDEEGFFRSFPNLHGIEGFFAAMFINKEE